MLQFVIVKPLMAVGTLTTYTLNHHEMLGWWGTTASIVYNLSYTVALYGLVGATCWMRMRDLVDG